MNAFLVGIMIRAGTEGEEGAAEGQKAARAAKCAWTLPRARRRRSAVRPRTSLEAGHGLPGKLTEGEPDALGEAGCRR